jgi:hypothetical protein
MPIDLDFSFLIPILVFFLLFAALIAASLIVGLMLAVRTWIRRRELERLEGHHTAAAQGARAGARLGLAAGVLSVILPAVAVSTPGIAEGLIFNTATAVMLMMTIAPPAVWGMLSGAIAGQSATWRSAAVRGGLLFLLLGNPLSVGAAVLTFLQLPDLSAEPHDLLRLLFLGSHVLFLLAVGAGTGAAAFHIGQRKAATHARLNASAAAPLDNRQGLAWTVVN